MKDILQVAIIGWWQEALMLLYMFVPEQLFVIFLILGLITLWTSYWHNYMRSFACFILKQS